MTDKELKDILKNIDFCTIFFDDPFSYDGYNVVGVTYDVAFDKHATLVLEDEFEKVIRFDKCPQDIQDKITKIVEDYVKGEAEKPYQGTPEEMEFADLLDEVKPYFEKRENYSWSAVLKNPVKVFGGDDKVYEVYSFHHNCFACGDYDYPLSELSEEEQSQIIKEAKAWLNAQDKCPQFIKDKL